jgi:cysteinyl-tRNA synthetase
VLKLFNSYGRRVKTFRPQRRDEVRMYTCGPTVWNFAHIGNFRTFAFEDILRKYLKFKGYKVTQVMNITDVEDKIIEGIKTTGKNLKELTEFYTTAFMEDIEKLNIEKAEHYPRATENIDGMVSMIERLIEKRYGYKADDGSVYFAIGRFKRYGKLSGIKPKELKSGTRVSEDHYEKAEARDFALWKAWDKEDGDVYWVTRLGKGRPGWHIECSVMSIKYLGETFDIHTGGIDNKFPHHENEIAQSEAATGKKFVRYWLHSQFLNVRSQKMSKSLANFITLRELIGQGWEPRTIRSFLISAHYRDEMNLTDDALKQTRAFLERMDEFVRRLASVKSQGEIGVGTRLARRFVKAFTKSMDEDLNTPKAFAALASLIRNANQEIDAKTLLANDALAILNSLRHVDSVLGIMESKDQRELPEELALLLTQRNEARAKRDYQLADELRQKLRSGGIIVQDTQDGTVWRWASKETKKE